MLTENHKILVDKGVDRVIISGGITNSHFHAADKTVWLLPNITEGEYLHEIAHGIARVCDIYRDPLYLDILEETAGDYVSLGFDLYEQVISDNGRIIDILITKSSLFPTYYSRRVYAVDELGNECWDHQNMRFNTRSLREVFTEAFKLYYLDPENLKGHNPRIYDYIDKLGR